MRLLVVVLLLANIGFLAWSRWVAPGTGTTAPVRAVTAPRLKLASEVGASAGDGASGAVSGCVSVGPFLDVVDVGRASMSLRSLGLVPRQRAAQGPVWAGYLVSINGVPTRAEADTIVAKLRQFGMVDAYVVDGPAPVTISLGLYTEEQRALRRLDEARAQGYSPELSHRERAGTVYWIDVNRDPSSAPIDTSSFQGESGRILRVELKACPTAAAPSAPVPAAGAPPGVPG